MQFHPNLLESLQPQLKSPRVAVMKRTIICLGQLVMSCDQILYIKVGWGKYVLVYMCSCTCARVHVLVYMSQQKILIRLDSVLIRYIYVVWTNCLALYSLKFIWKYISMPFHDNDAPLIWVPFLMWVHFKKYNFGKFWCYG